MRATARWRITRYRGGAARDSVDTLAAEEPLEIRVDGEPVSVTMRTPGHDFELALGFCYTEGILSDHDEVAGVRYCAGTDSDGRQTYNVVDVGRRRPGRVADELRRRVYTTSSCGICGTASIDAVRKVTAPIVDDVTVAASTLLAVPEALRAAQRLFDRTGGLHAAGIFTEVGEQVVVREDVGRHNAVDKVIGWAVSAGRLPLSGHILAVSGRVAFEIAQKAVRAGIPVVAAVSAPSGLAVELAEEMGLTIAGFVRGDTMNVYAGRWRVKEHT
jgi:FdhD protein